MNAGSIVPGGVSITGIKAIDLLCPIPVSGIVKVYGGERVGRSVLNMELAYRQKKYLQGYSAWIGLNRVETQRDLDDGGVADAIILYEGVEDSPDRNLSITLKALENAKKRCGIGGSALAFFELHPGSSPLNNDLVKQQLQQSGESGCACWIQRIADSSDDPDEPPATSPSNTSIFLSGVMASGGFYPAIDPLMSTSDVLIKEWVSADHLAVANGVINILKEYNDLMGVIQDLGVGELSAKDQLKVGRAKKVKMFLTQPFFAAEALTGVSGKYVDLMETIEGFKSILDGRCDLLPEQDFYNSGSLQDVKKKSSG